MFKMELYLGHLNKDFRILSASESESELEQCASFCILSESDSLSDRKHNRSV